MKQLIVYIFAFFYCISSSGASLYLHHCQGSTRSISLEKNQPQHKHCPLCNENKQKSCHASGLTHSDQSAAAEHLPDSKKSCQDIELSVKTTDDNHLLTASFDTFACHTAAVITLPGNFNVTPEYFFVKASKPKYQEIPIAYTSTPRYLKNCVFRIWYITSYSTF